MRKILETQLVWELNLVDLMSRPFTGIPMPRLGNARLVVMMGRIRSNEPDLKIRFKTDDQSFLDGEKVWANDINTLKAVGNEQGYSYEWAGFSRLNNAHEFWFTRKRVSSENSCTTICRGARDITLALGIDMRQWMPILRYPDVVQRTFWARHKEEPGALWLTQGRLAAQGIL